jgi:hypothetical protein
MRTMLLSTSTLHTGDRLHNNENWIADHLMVARASKGRLAAFITK